jgi:hypothetical protein
MLIECLIQREGPTEVWIEGFKHSFLPNKEGKYVCQVHSPHHQTWLLSFPHLYKEYKPAVVEKSGTLPAGLKFDPENFGAVAMEARTSQAEQPKPKPESAVVEQMPEADLVVPEVIPDKKQKKSLYANEL